MSGKNSFLNMVKDLEKFEENKGYLILVRCGAFFVAIGANAVILSNEVGLNTICMVKGICKVGIPLNSIYDYIKRLEHLNKSFVIYNYSKDEMIDNGKKYSEMYRNNGEYVDKMRIAITCETCEKYKRVYDNVTIFEELKRLQKLKEEQRHEPKQ